MRMELKWEYKWGDASYARGGNGKREKGRMKGEKQTLRQNKTGKQNVQERNARRSEVKLVKSAEKKKKDKLPTFPITAINYTCGHLLLRSRCILLVTP